MQSLAAHRLQQLDLHVAAAREAQRDRARHALAAQVVVEIGRGQLDELAAAERRAHRRSAAREVGDHVRLLEQATADTREKAADFHGGHSHMSTMLMSWSLVR